jgi:hypothetical protein
MAPDAEATFQRAINQVVRASDGPPFRQERRPTRMCELPGPVAVRLPKHALCRRASAGGSAVPWRCVIIMSFANVSIS